LSSNQSCHFTNSKNRRKEPYHIIAEIKEKENLEAAEVAGNGEAVFVYTSDLIARITAQTCRQSGLSLIYSNLIQFEGDEIYFHEQKELIGKTYKEILGKYDTSSILGFFSQGRALINPPMDTVYQQGDQLIAISEDDDTVLVNGKNNLEVKSHLFNVFKSSQNKQENTLILGWNKNASTIITELDEYVSEKSSVFILCEQEIDLSGIEVKNQTLKSQSRQIYPPESFRRNTS